ncbi:MAG: M67 family metallopeptidase [Desulfobacterota bacterium]|nr:M67 family metallopeptidase [Thermodesulfobacteriota bacterium]
MRQPVCIPIACRSAMIQHAMQELPNECCGILIGRNERIERAQALRNIEPSPDTYRMDPEEQVALFRAMEQRGEQLLGIYHSHPHGPPEPSALDLRLAFHPHVVYVIVSLEDPHCPQVRGFFLSQNSFAEVSLIFV